MAPGRRTCVPLLLHLIATLLALCAVASTQDECGEQFTCAACISSSPNCGWCDDRGVFQDYVENPDPQDTLGPARLCGTLDFLRNNLSCPEESIVNPESSFTSTAPVDPSNSQVFPASVDVTLRPGQPISFDITVKPAESISVDMYILLDLTFTQRPILGNLRTLASDLIVQMQSLTDQFRIGFGSFVDKTTAPFIDTHARAFPCAQVVNSDPSLTPDICQPAYSFRHSLDFTENSTKFEEVLENAVLSASTDPPEALYDALMQIALCEDQFDWSPRGQTRRIVLAMTDGDYHYALDGKVGGITTPPSKQCLVDQGSGEYLDNTLFDYPSSAFVADLLNERDIIPIFAVSQDVESVYLRLRSIIRNALIGDLQRDLLELVEEGYRNLSSTVVPVVTGLENLPLTYSVLPVNRCAPDGRLQNGSRDICVEVNPPNSTVNYTVTLEALPELCALNQGPLAAKIKFTGFGIVNVNINLECDCDCSDTMEPNSPNCNGTGTWMCSTCICGDNRGGPSCDCPVSSAASGSCVKSRGLDECSGNGECVCGKCVCNVVNMDNPDTTFTGDFCEYNPLICPKARVEDREDFEPCSGDNGECIDGECVCYEGWRGTACECTTNTTSCVGPLDDDTSFCSGEGTCKCGQCSCDDYTTRRGQFCEECKPCRESCRVIGDCVYCLFTKGESCPEGQCNITFINSTDFYPNSNLTLFKECSRVEDGCEVRFTVSTIVVGDEDHIYVVINENQNDLKKLMSDPDDCDPELLIWPIPVGIILGIIIVGIIAIVLWRCISYLGEYLEYRQWAKSVHDETSRTGSNPLFVDPTTKYPNPRYRQQQQQKQEQ